MKRVEVELGRLVTASQSKGWAAGRLSLSALHHHAEYLKLEAVAMRTGERPVAELTPLREDQARTRSISAVAGYGEQALHTDGAHLPHVPDLIIFHSEMVNSTPTRIWKPHLASGNDALRHGVFVVSAGRSGFLATALDESGLRFDPYCMTPADARASDAATYLTDPEEGVVEHTWDAPDKVLVLRNRDVLHARAAIPEDGSDRRLTRVAYYSPGGMG